MKRFYRVLFFAVFWLACVATPVYAYLDPGAGSMLLQLLLGGIAGVIVILKLYWQRFVSLFRRDSQKETKDSSSDSNQ